MNVRMKCQNLFLDFVFLSSSRWSCLNLSVDVCMHDVWLSERIVRMLCRICHNNVWMSEWSVRICFWISFSFCWVVLSKLICGFVYEWCMNVWIIVKMLWRICLNHVWMSECSVRICFWISFFFSSWWSCLNPSVEWCLNELLECCGESVWICLNAVSGFVFGFRVFSFSVVLSQYFCGIIDVWMSERIVRMLWENLSE